MPNAPVPEVIANGVKEEVKKREPPAMPEGIDSRLFFEKMRGAKGMLACFLISIYSSSRESKVIKALYP